MRTRAWTLVLLLVALLMPAAAQAQTARRTKNVFLVMADGLRWQEVFTGADERLINADNGVNDPEALRSAYWRPTPEARREALMPFLWKTAVPHGQIYGNLLKSSDAHVTNPWNVSYPGYSETFCGFPSEVIKGNSKVMNPDTTVFEWLESKPAYQGRVAAFGAWDVFPYIINTERSGLPVDGGVGPLAFGKTSPAIDIWNAVRAETPYRWGGACFDSMVFRPAFEWIKLNTPRVVFLGLGETDEWAHEGDYEQYLHAAHRVDAYLALLWAYIQSAPEYKDSTSIILLCDHGRGGDAPLTTPPATLPALEGVEQKQWRDHNSKVVGARQIWIAVWGPDTPPLGERANVPEVTQSQVAATLAALLGEDYAAAQPRAGRPIGDVLGGARRSGGD
ncbi:MAG: AP protein [Leptolyngbya sp. PLA3]|nr:MAG: AP protein [Cyanobacteria bacterium CYA]MCE7969503.1 AP protein [Leptolyngbya sp. PL-A3]